MKTLFMFTPKSPKGDFSEVKLFNRMSLKAPYRGLGVFFIFFIPFLFMVIDSGAQIVSNNTEWMQYVEDLAESDESDPNDIAQLFDELSYLSEHPFNLQKVTKQDLERLPFLTDIQIENLLYYIYKYSPLVDCYELKNVEGLDFQTITYLLPFVYVGEADKKYPDYPQKKGKPHLKQELLIRSDYTFQKKAGYQKVSDEERSANPNKYYLGEPYYLSIRYGLQYRDIQLGVIGEKDAGEAFWNKSRKGFDHYAFNLNIKYKGILEDLHLGDYRLSFGQGLVMNTNFFTGKTSDVGNINLKGRGISRHISTNEFSYFRGVAGMLNYKNTQLFLFYSHRKPDANADSSFIYTFKTDGYHRIPSDIQKKGTAQIDMGGAHIQWRNESFRIGLTAVYYSFGGKELNPTPQSYNLFYLRGKNHFNSSLNYEYHNRKISLQGETAIDASGKWATINSLLIKPASTIDWTVSYRNYAREYNAFYGKAFGESSTVQNETGFYTGIRFYPFRKWELSAYIDYFRFPWLKFGIDSPSSGTDGLIQLVYKHNSKIQMNLRYKYKEKYRNQIQTDARETEIIPYQQERWRYQLNYETERGFGLKTQIDYNGYASASNSSAGWSVTQMISFSKPQSKFQWDGSAAYFHAGNWNNRISIYEKNILYAFSFPNYYGEGLRFYSVIKWKITPSLTIYCKLASTHYFDREVISSGLEAIQRKDKTDLYGSLRYQF